MRKTTLYIALLTLILSACTSPRREAMRQRLQYVSACNRADTLFTARWLPTVDSLVSYFDPSSRSWTERIFSLPFREGAGVGSNERMMAHYLQGRVHHDMGEAPQALECYQKAAEQADTTSDDCDIHTLTAIYGQMADLFHAQYLPDDEMQALYKAEQCARNCNDTFAAIKAFELRIRPFFLKEEKDSMLFTMTKARDLYLSAGFRKEAAGAIFSAISINLDKRCIQKADSFLRLYESEMASLAKNDELLENGYYNYDKGRCLFAMNQIDSALPYFQKAINNGQPEAGFEGLLSIYEKKNIPDSVAKYARLLAAANDSSYMHVNQEHIHQISAMYDYSRQQQIAVKHADEARKAKRDRLALVIISIVLVISAYYFFKRYHRQSEEKLLRLSLAYDKGKAELAAAINSLQLLNSEYASLSRENDNIKKELLSRIQSKEKEIKALNDKTNHLETRLLQFSAVDMEASFKNSDIYRLFREHANPKYISNRPTETDWLKLIDKFRTHFVRYYAFITYEHELSANQYRYCILVRLGFDGNEIGILMGKDKDQRYHLRQLAYKVLFGEPIQVKMLEERLKDYF